jgi:RimJ/RimL family protein N-acetyltransferase
MPPRPLPNVPDVTVRPLRASDKDALLDLFERLSPQSRMRRFLSPKPRLSRREVAYLTEIDHRTHAALVAIAPDGAFVGIGRYACGIGQTEVADVAFAVADEWQGRGIGTALAGLITDLAHANGIARLQATTLPENGPARKLLGRMGFEVRGIADGVLDVEFDLAAAMAERDARSEAA